MRMLSKKNKKSKWSILAAGVIAIVFLLVVVTMFSNLNRDRQEQGRQQLENVLRRTAATCYASEGFYPPDVEYMCEHYGLHYDETQYMVYYQIFASNLMPYIIVLEK